MKNFYCIIFAIFLIFFITQSVVAVEYRYAKNGFKYAYHAHSESSYQHAWCSAHKGIVDDLYDRTGVADFYILDKSNKQFYLPKDIGAPTTRHLIKSYRSGTEMAYKNIS